MIICIGILVENLIKAYKMYGHHLNRELNRFENFSYIILSYFLVFYLMNAVLVFSVSNSCFQIRYAK
jgi:hypothetical protein